MNSYLYATSKIFLCSTGDTQKYVWYYIKTQKTKTNFCLGSKLKKNVSTVKKSKKRSQQNKPVTSKNAHCRIYAKIYWTTLGYPVESFEEVNQIILEAKAFYN